MKDANELTTHRTPAKGCYSCETRTRHTEETWKHHPEAGTGASKEHGAKKKVEVK